MLSLEQRLDKVEGIIKKPSFRQNKGLGNEVGYYIFDYPAEQELTVREYVEYIRQKNEEAIDGFRIAVFDLYDILISILKDKGYLALNLRRQKGLTESQRQLATCFGSLRLIA